MGDAGFTWDFIGHLQSRKVKDVLPLVRWTHSVGSDSVLDQLDRRATAGTEVLVEVNVAARSPARAASTPERCRACWSAPQRRRGPSWA